MRKRREFNRRRFLLAAAGAMGAGMLACGGGLALLATPPAAVNFGQTSCGKGTTMQKVLVVYASRCGSTVEVAQAVAEQLCRRGDSAEVCAVEEASDPANYDAVVVGSAIRMGKWLPAAVQFVERHQATLAQKPTAFFTVHMLNVDDSAQSRAARAEYVAPVHALLAPQAEAFFAGKMDFARLNFMDRLMAKMVKSKEQDLRNWTAIRTWGDQLFV